MRSMLVRRLIQWEGPPEARVRKEVPADNLVAGWTISQSTTGFTSNSSFLIPLRPIVLGFAVDTLCFSLAGYLGYAIMKRVFRGEHLPREAGIRSSPHHAACQSK